MKLLLAIGVTVFLFAPVIQGKFDKKQSFKYKKLEKYTQITKTHLFNVQRKRFRKLKSKHTLVKRNVNITNFILTI